MLLQKSSDTGKTPVWIMTEWDACISAVIKEKIKPEDTVILNGDDEQLLRDMAGIVCHIVTYGYHLKSTLTVSGREEDITTGTVSYSFALQRPLQTFRKKLIEPCELKWSGPADVPLQSVMAAVAYSLVTEVAFFS